MNEPLVDKGRRVLGIVPGKPAVGDRKDPHDQDLVMVSPHLLVRHAVVALAVLLVVLLLALLFDAPLRDVANPFETPNPDIGDSVLRFVWKYPLTDAGGINDLLHGIEGTCLYTSTVEPGCGTFALPNRNPNNIDMFGIAAPVPIPASVWLFGSALGLLGWMRRRK